MKTFLPVLAAAALLVACERITETAAPPASPSATVGESTPTASMTPESEESTPPPIGEKATPPPDEGTSPEERSPIVDVYFATDRLPSGLAGPKGYFGNGWNKTDDHVSTGIVRVSIPPGHEEGKVERPVNWIVWERKEDPSKDFVLVKTEELSPDTFYQRLRNEFSSRSPAKRSALVFIHGFNVTFDEAAYNTAQLTYDLHFAGVPMMYSWPSQGHVLAYDGDGETADWSAPHLQNFLERVSRESGALRIHLIAHSMGNRVMTTALKEIGRQPDIQPLFQDVIMAAPDVNAYKFTDQLWPALKRAAKHFTLYASSDDRALQASKKAKGRADFRRLGEAGPNIVVIDGMDTIDATGIDTSLLGHSYVDSCKPVLTDLSLLIEGGFAPMQRKLHDRRKEGLAYWAFH